jgi:hypothetical protein
MRRMGATWGLALIDIPASTMPSIGDVWDIGTLIFLDYYCYIKALKDALRSAPKSK